MHSLNKNWTWLLFILLLFVSAESGAAEQKFTKSSIKKCLINKISYYQKYSLQMSIKESKHVGKKLKNKKKIMKQFKDVHKKTTLMYIRGAELLLKKNISSFQASPVPDLWFAEIQAKNKELRKDRIFKKLYNEYIQTYSNIAIENRKYDTDEYESAAIVFIQKIQYFESDYSKHSSCYPELARQDIAVAPAPVQNPKTSRKYTSKNHTRPQKNTPDNTEKLEVVEEEPKKRYFPKYINRKNKDHDDESPPRPKYLAR